MTQNNINSSDTYKELTRHIRELENRLKNPANREYKSRLFSFIFGREDNRRWTMSLYNALHGTSHNDPACITINTIEDVVYMGMKNDLSILVSETVSFYQSMEIYEQQSSYNPNMPVREFMYAGKLYNKFIHAGKMNHYGRTLIPLPLPRLVVFYNGKDEAGDETTLYLSDAFRAEIRRNIIRQNHGTRNHMDENRLSAEVEAILRQSDPDIEVKVRMININHGHSKKLLSLCRPLNEYAWFVAQVRKNHSAQSGLHKEEKMGIEEAIDLAINEMPEDFEIKKFITANRAEVKDMCLTEYNETETMEMLRLEGLQEGLQKGRQETRLTDIINLMDCTGWTADQAMNALKIPEDQRSALYADINKQ